MPAPPASASSAKTSRTSVASTPRRAARPPHTPARTRSCRLRSKASADSSVTRPDDVDPAGSDASLDLEQAGAARLDLCVAAVVVALQRVDVTGLRLRIDRDLDVARDDDPQVPDADMRGDMRLRRHGETGQVDTQV